MPKTTSTKTSRATKKPAAKKKVTPKKTSSKTKAKTSAAKKAATKKKTAPKKKTTKTQTKKKYGPEASRLVAKEMRAFKKGKAHSGKAKKPVKSKKQAIAIGLSKARKKGVKVPKKAAA